MAIENENDVALMGAQTEGTGEGQQTDGGDDHAAIEAEAAAGGWQPQDRWRGAPDEWVDAETFVKRGREINPILRKNNERLQAEIRARDAEINEIKQTMAEFAKFHEQTEAKAYERAIADLRKERREALESMDGERFDEVEQQIEMLQEARKSAAQPAIPAAPAQQPAISPDFDPWAAQNPWYMEDARLRAAADAEGQRLRAEGTHLTDMQFLNEVRRRVDDILPARYKSGRAPGRVEGGTAHRGSTGSRENYESLPKEAKEMCDKFVARGLVTREKYVADYYGNSN